MELKPGTPEYQEAYEKEMQRLEAEASGGETKPEAKPATTSAPDDKAETKAAEKADEKAKTESADEIRARLASVEKALEDTKRWAHGNAAEVKRLKKEAEERKRTETRPAILDANPGLEDAITHVAGTPKVPPQEQWIDTVARAIPDVEQLLGDPAFHAKAAAKRTELGGDWDDPITAIRELSSIRTEHLNQKSIQVAVEAARKDFEAKAKKRNAMEVPGGSGGKDAGVVDDDAVKRYQTMSKTEFDKERSRVMGY